MSDRFVALLPILVTHVMAWGSFIGIWILTDPNGSGLRLSILKPQSILTSKILFILGILNLSSGIWFPWPVSSFDFIFYWGGLGVFILGTILCIWAKLTMRKSWGVPGQHDINKQTKLVTSGPFGYSRNPIYVGLILMTLGSGISVRSYFLILSLWLIHHFRRMVEREEILLVKYFGGRYRSYTSTVPRFL